MKTAIITGASSGLGREFARQLTDIFPEIECCWLIARREDRLEEIAREMVGVETVCLPLDCAIPCPLPPCRKTGGGETGGGDPHQQRRLRLPGPDGGDGDRCPDPDGRSERQGHDGDDEPGHSLYAGGGTHPQHVFHRILLPTPRMTVYGASKAYVSSFTVGLSEELKRRDITVTAVCPGPMKTEFLDVGSITGRSPAFEYLPYCDQVRVAAGALRAAKAGRTMYTPRLFYKFYRLLAKVAPVKLMVKFTKPEMSWNCNTFRQRDVLQSPLVSCQISQKGPRHGDANRRLPSQTSEAFVMGSGGTTEHCELSAQRERVEHSLSRRQGGVPVSTGVWRRDQRAAAPDRHKTGNLKIN